MNANRTRILLNNTEKLPGWEKTSRKNRRAGSYDVLGHAKKCVEICCELANRKTDQLYKVSTPCLDDHNFKEEEMETVGHHLRGKPENEKKW